MTYSETKEKLRALNTEMKVLNAYYILMKNSKHNEESIIRALISFSRNLTGLQMIVDELIEGSSKENGKKRGV